MPENVPDLTPPATPAVLSNTYTSIPTDIEAAQWDGTEDHARALCDWADTYRGRGSACFIERQEPIPTNYADNGKPIVIDRPARIVIGLSRERGGLSAGQASLYAGDWLIKGTEDEFYPCPDSVFRAKYRRKATPINLSGAPRVVFQGGDISG